MNKITNHLLAFIIGIIVTGGIGITIAYNINASQISYEDTDVASAITDLYTLSQTHCPEGLLCISKSLGGMTIEPSGRNDTYKAIIYLDPTNLTKKCTKSQYEADLTTYKETKKVNTPTGQKSDCMKWYIYNQDNSYYYAILDHNTTAMVSTDCNGNCWESSKLQLREDINNWDSNLHSRNITANEIWNITKDTNGKDNFDVLSATKYDSFYFNSDLSNGTGYAWLFDYSYDSTSYGGTINDSSNYGYWLSEGVYGSPEVAWYIGSNGFFNYSGLINQGYGVRPIIMIPKN